MSHLKGFFKKITGDTTVYDALSKQPIIDAELKLNLFKEVTSASISGIDSYLKYMTKAADQQLADKFLECRDLFKKYETKGDLLNPTISHVMGIVFGKLSEMQQGVHDEVLELTKNIESKVLKPLNDYQREVSIVKENRKELKEAYDKIEQCRQSLEKAKREVENAQRSTSQSSRLTMMVNADTANKKMNEVFRLEEKVQRAEKELDEATATANEKYDKYTEALYKRVSDECELTNCYLEYLKIQRRYHRQVLKRLDHLIPGAKESMVTYNKKPVFGCSLGEYVSIQNGTERTASGQSLVSPVIRKLVEGMCKQGVFAEEGIFRVAGSRIKMNCILYAINAGYLDHLDLANDYDVHCLAGVLKQYIRELPDSILCNDLYDSWIGAINTSPLPNKIEAFRSVLNKLPRTNYENMRYLIKFLAKIVENSEKTKMTTTNMGICFGVSLISSNSSNCAGPQLSSPSSIHMNSNNSSSSPASSSSSSSTPQHDVAISRKMIDMATATNVFDFLLTNHNELLPGEINFSSGSVLAAPSVVMSSAGGGGGGGGSSTLNSRHTFYHSSSKQPNVLFTGEHPGSKQQQFSNKDERESNQSNRHSVMIHEQPSETVGLQSVNKYSNNNNNSSSTSSPSTISNSSFLSTQHVNRHIKNNSMDMRFSDEAGGEIGSLGSGASPILGSSSNQNSLMKASFPPIASQTNASSTVSLDATGSNSPKQSRSKKQAPAPPKNAAQNEASFTTNNSQTANNSLLSTSLIESTHSLSSGSSTHNVSLVGSGGGGGGGGTGTKLESNSEVNSHTGNNLMTKLTNQSNSSVTASNSDDSTSPPSSSLSNSALFQSPVSTSNKPNETTSLDKPNQPPPQVPNSIRPIGFNLSGLLADESEKDATPSAPPNPPLPYPTVDSFPEIPKASVTPLGSTPPNPVKPTVPRRPANGIAAQLNRFQKLASEDPLSPSERSKTEVDSASSSSSSKTSPEITSL